jgi:hypothetical protein
MKYYLEEPYSIDSDTNRIANDFICNLRERLDRRIPSWIKADVFDSVNMRLGTVWTLHSRTIKAFYDTGFD